jgi:uncharacterized membrane protein
MTLLVVSIDVPHLSDGDSVGELADAINDLSPQLISFFISFAVIGRYWLAHHQSIGLMKAMDSSFIGLNLLYLAFIAFLPFPTALLGEYFENPLSIAIYAATVGVISTMEVVLFRHSYRADLLQVQPAPEVYRYGVTASLSPVAFFALSIPVAFLSTSLAVACWFLVIPFAIALERRAPKGAEELLGS